MDIIKMSEAGINYTAGLHRFAGKPELYNKYLLKFFDDTSFSELSGKLAAGEYKDAFMLAHSLKGMSGNLSLDAFYADICELVEALRHNETEGLTEKYDKAAQSYEKARDAVVK